MLLINIIMKKAINKRKIKYNRHFYENYTCFISLFFMSYDSIIFKFRSL